MKARRIGRTNIEVTELGFGGAPIGNLRFAVDDTAAAEAVEAAWELGVRYFDTAPLYGLGLSERRLGQALSTHARQDCVLSTKVGRLLSANPNPTGSYLSNGFDVADGWVPQPDYSADGALRSIESSLSRLGTDRIDIVLIHDPDEFIEESLAGALPALLRLRDENVIGAVGVGMNQWQAPLRFLTEADIDVIMLAGRWTMADRSGEPLMQACVERHVSVLAAAPFNSGLLSRAWPAEGALFNNHRAPDDVLAHARKLALTCERHQVSMPRAALQFPLRHQVVASVVTGMRSRHHVLAAAESLADPAPETLWADL